VLRQRQIPVRTVIDVGVLNGTPELVAAYPDCMHLLFEPVSEFAASIEMNYRAVAHRLVQSAVSDRSGTVSLATRTLIPGLEISHSSMTDDPQADTRTVPTVSLDDYLARAPAEPPFFLKVDIDGHEMKVLAGAAQTLKQSSIVMIETTADTLPERVGFLLSAGFQLFDLTEPCYYDDCFAQCDAVFVHPDLYPRHFATMTAERFDFGKWTSFSP
jgi:FkbM family methyltransferase